MTILWILMAWVLLDRVLCCLIARADYAEALEQERDECMEALSGLRGPSPVGFGVGRWRRS